jgi:ketosteroid isomerase-like protein
MSTSTETEIRTVVDDYIAVWNEPDGERRRALIARTFTEDAAYLDPMMSGAGHDGIDAMVAAAQQQFPGHRFVLAGEPDAHHDRARFTWNLVADGGGAPAAIGLDFATLAEDGRLRSVTGFLEAVA